MEEKEKTPETQEQKALDLERPRSCATGWKIIMPTILPMSFRI